MAYCLLCRQYKEPVGFDLGVCPGCREKRNSMVMPSTSRCSVCNEEFQEGDCKSVIPVCPACQPKLDRQDSTWTCTDNCKSIVQEHVPTESELRRARIRNERGAEYGETYRNFRTLGQQITALLEQHYQIDLPHPVPASIAALILVEVKTNRLSRPMASQDSFDDAVNYVNIVEECRTHERLETEAKNPAGGGGQGNRPAPAGEPTATGS